MDFLSPYISLYLLQIKRNFIHSNFISELNIYNIYYKGQNFVEII